jgi:transposase
MSHPFCEDKMRGKKAKLPDEFAGYNFRSLVKRERNARVRLRLLGLAHLQEGNTITATAQMCRVERSIVYDWIDRFKRAGIEGLKEQEGRGLKPKLSKDQHQTFREAVLELQNQRSGGRIKGLDVMKLMQEKLGIECSLDTVYRALAKVGLVWISARSKHPKTDVAAQDAFKKTSKKK